MSKTVINPGFRLVIPARFASTRLPGKPLRLLAGRTLIEHVYRQALASGAMEVVIATDDSRIRDVAIGFGAAVCMTSSEHLTGTDRLAEVAAHYGWPDGDIVVNLQGDEPRIPPRLVRQVAGALEEHPGADIATACAPIHQPGEVFDPHAVKVVRDRLGYALYFSRAPIPWNRDSFGAGDALAAQLPPANTWLRHIGLYAYRVAVLRRYPFLPPAPIEQVESLEQLRALWHGIRVFVVETPQAPPPGVDTEADLARMDAELKKSGQQIQSG